MRELEENDVEQIAGEDDGGEVEQKRAHQASGPRRVQRSPQAES